MTTVARLLRGLVPVLAAFTAATAVALPAGAAVTPAPPPVVTPADQWWLSALRVSAAVQAAPAAGKGVTVAVLSTGVDGAHPDLAGAVTTGPDYSKTGRTAGTSYWGAEGTAVAGLIAGHGHSAGQTSASGKSTSPASAGGKSASPDTGGGSSGATNSTAGGSEGITGIAPAARILSVQVSVEYDDPLAADPAVTRRLPDAIADGIRWAVGHGATVIALPLDPGALRASGQGNPAAGGSAAEKSAVSFALAHNVVLVAPAGDNGANGNAINYPAAYPGVIAVGATTRDGQLSPFSSTRSYVTLTAPGAGITPDPPIAGGMTADPAAGLLVAAPGGGYEPLASSDMSAGLTAGVAALIRSRYPWLTALEVTQAIERGVTAPGGAQRPAGGTSTPGDIPQPRGSANTPAGSPLPTSTANAARKTAGWGYGALDAEAALSAAAAIAAAHPAPSPSAAVTPAPAAGLANASGSHQTPADTGASAAPHPAGDPGHLVRSLVVGLAIAAGVLIAGLVVASTLTGRRRRADRSASRSAGPARHAKKQAGPPTSPIPARVVIWASTPAPGEDASGRARDDAHTPRDELGSAWGSAATTRADPGSARDGASDTGSTWDELGSAWLGSGAVNEPAPTAKSRGRSAGPHRHAQATGNPPWQPAAPPREPGALPEMLPAQTTVEKPDPALPPWDLSPAEFAVAPPPPADNRPPWRISNTGPMYVWNPATATGPIVVINHDDD